MQGRVGLSLLVGSLITLAMFGLLLTPGPLGFWIDEGRYLASDLLYRSTSRPLPVGRVLVLTIDEDTVSDRELLRELLERGNAALEKSGAVPFFIDPFAYRGNRIGDREDLQSISMLNPYETALYPSDTTKGGFIQALPSNSAESVQASRASTQMFTQATLDGIRIRAFPLAVVPPHGDEPTVIHVVARAVAHADGAPDAISVSSGTMSLGDRNIPLDELGQMRINFLPRGFVRRPADFEEHLDYLQANPDVDLEGTVVVVGTSDDPGQQTPVGNVSYLQVFAMGVNTILTDNHLTSEPLWLTLLLTFVASSFGIFLGANTRWWVGVAGVLTILFVYSLLAWARMGQGVITDIGVTSVASIVGFGIGSQTRGRENVRQRRQLEKVLMQHVPREIAQQLLDREGIRRLAEGERREATVLFCDLRDFTGLAAGLEPTQVRQLLDAFYRYVSDAVISHRGTLIQYVGDEVLALFGAPLESSEHRSQAIACARDIQSHVTKLDRDLTEEGLPTIRFGIGVHTGEVVVAVVGTDAHKQYSVIGDAVNVGSRLTDIARAEEIVASGEALRGLDQGAERIEDVAMKGVGAHVHAFRLRGGTDRSES